MKKVMFGAMLTLLLISMLTMAFNVQVTMSSEPPPTEWGRTYNQSYVDVPDTIIQTADGGYAIVGQTGPSDTPPFDIWLVKTNATGHVEWNRTYGGTGDDAAGDFVQTNDYGYAIAGYTTSKGAGQHDMWLVKVNSTGHVEWDRTYGSTNIDVADSIVQTRDGGYALAGMAGGSPTAHGDFWLVKTNATGHMEWNRTYGTASPETARSLDQTSDGGYAMAGNIGDDWLLVKTNSTGHMEWNQTYNLGSNDEVHSAILTKDGGYAIVGHTDLSGPYNVWLVKTNSTGHAEWNRTYGRADVDDAMSIVQTSEGGYAFAGIIDGAFYSKGDAWLVKIDSTGLVEWNQTYPDEGYDIAHSVIQTRDGGYALVIQTGPPWGPSDFRLIKLSPEKILATVNIDPDTLNLKSNGQWITAYITLPNGYNVEDIVLETVKVNGISAAWSDIQNGVYMAKFDRATVQTYLTNEPDYESAPKFYDITLTVTGGLTDGTLFEGTDTITVIKK